MSDEGLAIFFPAISGADPCCAWATISFSPKLTPGAKPKLPEI